MPKVTAKLLEKYMMDIDTGNHQWTMDVPAKAGGGDAAPTPFEVLTAAMAACKCFVVKRYANNSKLPLESVEATVDGGFEKPDDPASFRMKAEIKVKGNLDDKDLQRLLRAAEACPIKKAVVATSDVECSITKV